MAGNLKKTAAALAVAGGTAALAIGIGWSGAVSAQDYPLPPTTVVAQLPPPPPPTPPAEQELPSTGGSNLSEGILAGTTLGAAGVGMVLIARRRRHNDAPAPRGT
jgi:LPXTG-motif cell wall-anchored protein